MPAAHVPEEDRTRGQALAAIEEAIGMVGQAGQAPDHSDGAKKKRNEHGRSQSQAPQPLQTLPAAKGIRPRLFGLLALGCIGVAALAWRSNGDEITSGPIATSSVQIKSRVELATPSASPSSDLETTTGAQPPEAPSLSGGAPTNPMVASVDSELARQIQDIARELSNVSQGIDRLKAEQSPIAHENAELAERLKGTDAVARHNAELAEDIKTTQSRLSGAIDNLTDQLKANQALMATLAEQLQRTQEQVAHLASLGQRQRPRILPPVSPTVTGSTQKPAVKPPGPVGAQNAKSSGGQPKQ